MPDETVSTRFQTNDHAVSPVIAVILMAAIAVVLSTSLYLWTGGFADNGGDPGPSAAFDATGCDTASGDDAAETLTVKLLTAPGSLTPGDLRVEVSEEANGAEAGSWSIPSGAWNVGTSKTFTDDTDADDLTSGTLYVIDLVHTPSGNIIGSPQRKC